LNDREKNAKMFRNACVELPRAEAFLELPNFALESGQVGYGNRAILSAPSQEAAVRAELEFSYVAAIVVEEMEPSCPSPTAPQVQRLHRSRWI
jgi:hypothetical protein